MAGDVRRYMKVARARLKYDNAGRAIMAALLTSGKQCNEYSRPERPRFCFSSSDSIVISVGIARYGKIGLRGVLITFSLVCAALSSAPFHYYTTSTTTSFSCFQ